jgi:hypothetical protein
VMDAFEGPLGSWLLHAYQKADAETALTFLDSICRRFFRELAAAEARKLSVCADFCNDRGPYHRTTAAKRMQRHFLAAELLYI